MTDVNELLARAVETAEKPKPFPAGNYIARVLNYKFDTSSKKQTPMVVFDVQLEGPGPDMDLAQLVDCVFPKTIKLTYFVTQDALYRLRNFLEKSLKLNTTGRTFQEVLPETKGQVFLAVVKIEQGQARGGEEPSLFNNIEAALAFEG